MRICCMIASLRLGGAERQLAGLACMLKQAGHDAELLTYRDGDFYTPQLDKAGVNHVFIRQKAGEMGLVRDIADHLETTGCDMLISFLAGTNIKACLVKRRLPGLKLIVSERNTNINCMLHDRLRFALYRKYAWKVVCNSYAQTEFIRRHAPSLAGKLYTVPNFTDLELFHIKGARARAEGEPFRVVTTARLAPRKNAPGLIRAAAQCPGIRFDWYGADENDAYSTRCHKMIAELKLQDRFFIHPASASPEKIYGSADAFCLPSFYEGMPNSLAEAMACGLPAACSNVSDNGRYVIEGRNGFLFDPADSRQIAAAITKLSQMDATELEDAGIHSRALAEAAFNKQGFISRYLEIIGGPQGGTKREA
mgnify:CR=1 FL=1